MIPCAVGQGETGHEKASQQLPDWCTEAQAGPWSWRNLGSSTQLGEIDKTSVGDEVPGGTPPTRHVTDSAQPPLCSSSANAHSAWSRLQKCKLGRGLCLPTSFDTFLSPASSMSKASTEQLLKKTLDPTLHPSLFSSATEQHLRTPEVELAASRVSIRLGSQEAGGDNSLVAMSD